MSTLNKDLNKWFTRVLLISFIALVGIGGLCRQPYTRNPNLKFLVGDTIYSSLDCFYPLVSVNGQKIYYLAAPTDSFSETGSLYSINIDGTNNEELLYGYFDLAAISSTDFIALHPCEDNSGLNPESLILLLELSSMRVDTLPIITAKVSNVEFSSDGSQIYYCLLYTSPSPRD